MDSIPQTIRNALFNETWMRNNIYVYLVPPAEKNVAEWELRLHVNFKNFSNYNVEFA